MEQKRALRVQNESVAKCLTYCIFPRLEAPRHRRRIDTEEKAVAAVWRKKYFFNFIQFLAELVILHKAI